jgi:hypothetical protein
MQTTTDRTGTVRNFVSRVFSEDLHAKRVLSLADGALGVVTGASLAVAMIGHALAQARGLVDKHAIKQVDRLLSNQGVRVWDLFAPWIRHAVGERQKIVVAMDWTDFDADDQTTLALHLVTGHGRATPLLWLTVGKDELKDRRNDFEDLCLCRRDCQESCVRGRVGHHALTNLSSNMMANWVFASHHSRGGIFHVCATWRKTRNSNLIAASSVGK